MSWITSDPYIRVLIWVAVLVVIGALLSVVNALWLGVLDISGTPRSQTNRDLLAAQNVLERNPDSADAWQTHLVYMIESGNLSEARHELDQARQRDLDVTQGQQLLFVEALIEKKSGRDKEAVVLFQQVADSVMDFYTQERERGSASRNWALTYGLHKNYGLSLLEIAKCYLHRSEWEKAEATLTLYLATYPTEAGVFVDRANVRKELGDSKGAAQDYRKALEFVPDFQEAIDGLKTLGEER